MTIWEKCLLISNLEAKVAIWITTDPRIEHVTAIEYLNEIVPPDTKFYLLKLQAFKIGDSAPAPFFTIVSGPSEERTALGEEKKELAALDEKRFTFFKEWLLLCNQKTNIFSAISPMGYQNWLSAGAGKAGLAWSFVANKKDARIELFLCGQTAETNKKRFEYFELHKEEIESSFGEQLVWDYNPNRKQQYVRSYCPFGGIENEDKWTRIHSDIIEKLIKLDKVFTPFIKNVE